MLYIIVALKTEAQAFVEKYRLQKSKLSNNTLYTSDSIRLIISQMGSVNARNATQTLINQFDITDDDIFLNIGICGASSRYAIGSLLEIGSLVYDGIEYRFKEKKLSLVCVDEAVENTGCVASASPESLTIGAPDGRGEIVDMESYGFYDAVIHNPAIKNFHILKVVSDHFEPQSVTKDGTKKLLSKKIDAINTLITWND